MSRLGFLTLETRLGILSLGLATACFDYVAFLTTVVAFRSLERTI
jgi:hypothetical protein